MFKGMMKTVAMYAAFSVWSLIVFTSYFASAADDIHIGDLVVKQAWARATIGKGTTGAAYFTVMNNGKTADRLVSVETAAARRAGLHTHIMDGDVMKMRPVEAIEIAPSAMVALKPGGGHVMMMGLESPLDKGKAFTLTLAFENAGPVDVTVHIAGAAAKSHTGGHSNGHHKSD